MITSLPSSTLADTDLDKWLRIGATHVFDSKALLGLGLPRTSAPQLRDLMVMWWLLEPDRRTYEPETLIRKELRREPIDPAETAALLFDLAPILEKRLKDQELAKVYETIEAPLTPILCDMQTLGIGFDPKPLVLLSKKMSRQLARLGKNIHEAAGGPFNINSPRQLAEVLFIKLGLAAHGIRKTEKMGVISTRESELVKLRAAHPIVADVLRYRELAKLKSTYADALPGMVGADGRIHSTWNQTGTATGRLSSANPNLQNIPIRSPYGREIRKAFVAARGFTFVAFDYSQLELRIAADLASDEKMSAAFRKELDIHALTAAEVNNIPVEQVTPQLRYKAKALNFGILYGMGARAFAESAGISRDEAEHFMEEYFRDFAGIARCIEEQKSLARTHGFTRTAFGRKRFFPDITATNFRLQREAERQAVNFPIQGTEADIMKKAMIAVDGWIADQRLRDSVRMLLQIHDELIFEVRSGQAKAVIPEIRRLMESVWHGQVAMRVEVKQGKNWGQLE
jgi:DNA polymerase-1